MTDGVNKYIEVMGGEFSPPQKEHILEGENRMNFVLIGLELKALM